MANDGKERVPWEDEVAAMIEQIQSPAAIEAARKAFDTPPRVDISSRSRVRAVRERAVQIFSTLEEADHWLSVPCEALGGMVPRDVARRDEAGALAVQKILDHSRRST